MKEREKTLLAFQMINPEQEKKKRLRKGKERKKKSKFWDFKKK